MLEISASIYSLPRLIKSCIFLLSLVILGSWNGCKIFFFYPLCHSTSHACKCAYLRFKTGKLQHALRYLHCMVWMLHSYRAEHESRYRVVSSSGNCVRCHLMSEGAWASNNGPLELGRVREIPRTRSFREIAHHESCVVYAMTPNVQGQIHRQFLAICKSDKKAWLIPRRVLLGACAVDTSVLLQEYPKGLTRISIFISHSHARQRKYCKS